MKRKNHLLFILSLLGMLLGITACAPQPLFFTVTYVSEYGKAPEAIVVEENAKLTSEQLPSLTHEGYTFLGWCIGETVINADSYEVKSDVTLTAKWEKVVVEDNTETEKEETEKDEEKEEESEKDETEKEESEPRKTLKQRINDAKEGETIDLGKEEITINSDESYTVDKKLTIVNGDAKNATFTVTADGVLFKNVANVHRIIAGEELGDGDLSIRNCFEIKYLHVNGGGSNSIHIASTEIEELKVSKKDVRIVLETDEEGESTAKVNKAIIEKDCKLEGAEGLKFGTVQIENESNLTIGEETDISEFKYKLAEGMFINEQNCDCGVDANYEVSEDGTVKFWINKTHTGDYTEWHTQLSLDKEYKTAGLYKVTYSAKADAALNLDLSLWCQSKNVTASVVPIELTTEFKEYSHIISVHEDLLGVSNLNLNMGTTPIYIKDLVVEKIEPSVWSIHQDDSIFSVKEGSTTIGTFSIVESTENSVKAYRYSGEMETVTENSQSLVYIPNITTAGSYKFVFTDDSYLSNNVDFKNNNIFKKVVLRYKDGTEKAMYSGFVDSKGTYYLDFNVTNDDLSKGIEFVFKSKYDWKYLTENIRLSNVAVKPSSETVEGIQLNASLDDIILSDNLSIKFEDVKASEFTMGEHTQDSFEFTLKKDCTYNSSVRIFWDNHNFEKGKRYLCSFVVDHGIETYGFACDAVDASFYEVSPWKVIESNDLGSSGCEEISTGKYLYKIVTDIPMTKDTTVCVGIYPRTENVTYKFSDFKIEEFGPAINLVAGKYNVKYLYNRDDSYSSVNREWECEYTITGNECKSDVNKNYHSWEEVECYSNEENYFNTKNGSNWETDAQYYESINFDDEKLTITYSFSQAGLDFYSGNITYATLIRNMIGHIGGYELGSVEIVQNSSTSFTVKTSRIDEGNYSETEEWIWTKLD